MHVCIAATPISLIRNMNCVVWCKQLLAPWASFNFGSIFVQSQCFTSFYCSSYVEKELGGPSIAQSLSAKKKKKKKMVGGLYESYVHCCPQHFLELGITCIFYLCKFCIFYIFIINFNVMYTIYSVQKIS